MYTSHDKCQAVNHRSFLSKKVVVDLSLGATKKLVHYNCLTLTFIIKLVNIDVQFSGYLVNAYIDLKQHTWHV